ncbi:hypothetical protein HCEG_02738 [Histoplasma capsulatum var. duboisii H88]|uniref:Uncharacterized protein n=1 Tax=Ajellomyces capsulatus (strain H88) TaxID=544711 RepID=F0UDD9_AJEC8|nr:hypothetical protein HCEG_02738 [Histoplasma capsulatum var. duboisii H88]
MPDPNSSMRSRSSPMSTLDLPVDGYNACDCYHYCGVSYDLISKSGPDQAVIGKQLGGEEMPRPLSSLKSPFFESNQDQVTAWNKHGPVCKVGSLSSRYLEHPSQRHSRSMKSFLVKLARAILMGSRVETQAHIQSMMKQLVLDLHPCIGSQTVLWLLPRYDVEKGLPPVGSFGLLISQGRGWWKGKA